MIICKGFCFLSNIFLHYQFVILFSKHLPLAYGATTSQHGLYRTDHLPSF